MKPVGRFGTDLLSKVFKNRKVLITGNTGFKGSWLTCLLLMLEADIAGISIDIPTTPSMFETLSLEERIRHYFADISDDKNTRLIIEQEKPDFIFHLAAQPIVSESYKNPLKTYQANVMGTASVLEAVRNLGRKCVLVMITSDKCYDNVEWCWGYRETDALGGKDPYSASKAAAENVIKSYYYSFFRSGEADIRLISARAGNVIGGGDWADSRIVPDCIRAWAQDRPVVIRNPMATRPWQHVLEPLSGYLTAACALEKNKNISGEPYNFGPPSNQVCTVKDLLLKISRYWGYKDSQDKFILNENAHFHEAGLLKLDCVKAFYDLNWRAVLDIDKTAEMTAKWYSTFYSKKQNIYEFTLNQISEYFSHANSLGAEWAR